MQTAKALSRIFGLVWIGHTPLLLIMSALSTVHSQTAYEIQLIFAAVVCAIGVPLGIWALFASQLALRGLRLLSWISSLYYAAVALNALLGATALVPAAISALLFVALMSLPYAVMAVALRRTIRLVQQPPNNSFKPNPLRGSA